MIAFLRWLRSILASVLNSIAKFVALLVLVFAVLIVVGLMRGDGLPDNMILTLDMRQAIADSASRPPLPLTARPVTMMDLIFALEDAGRDKRIKGVVMRLGQGLSLAQAEELTQALSRFKAKGKFVIAQTTGFEGPGLGDYLAATAANEIWVQPKSDFAVAGAGAGEIFLRGLFDKVHATPQMIKRAEYKSAADMYTEKSMSDPDRDQLNAVMQSWYDAALGQVAGARRLTKDQVRAAFEASPQFAEDAKAKGLLDRIGYDDDALSAAMGRAGTGAKTVTMSDYIKTRDAAPAISTANVAVIEAAGEIADGTASSSLLSANAGIASDDLSAAIRQATRDTDIKVILLRVDSPGGSVTASDQILDAVKKAQAKGKPVVVSMGGVAASGGYYISTSADRIVAEPGTLTGSIGVLTGKVSFGGTADMVGVKLDEVAIGKNTLMDSPVQPYTSDQLAAVNHEADVIYDDFLGKVASGRHLPLAQVQNIARGRVWTGADAATHGLVNSLGGFWTAAGVAAELGKLPASQLAFRVYPKPRGFWDEATRLFGAGGDSVKTLENMETLMNLPAIHMVAEAVHDAPRRSVELRATNLPLSLGN
jgi:protease IV